MNENEKISTKEIVNPGRLQYLDVLKGIAIFLVVMGHFLAWNVTITKDDSHTCALIRNLIYSFHMPLFFFISGYLIDIRKKQWNFTSACNVLVKRVRSLLVPGVTTMLIAYTCFSTWYFEWFLRALFIVVFCFVIVKFVANCLKCNLIVEVVLHAVVFCGVLILVRAPLAQYQDFLISPKNWNNDIYFILGYLYCKRPSWQRIVQNNSLFYSTITIIFIVAFYIRSYVWELGLFSFVTALCGICISFYLATNNKNKNALVRFFNVLGKNSLAIYILSGFFIPRLYIVNELIVGEIAGKGLITSVASQIVLGTTVTLYVCGICLLLDLFLKKSIILDFLFHGSLPQKKE